MYIRSKLKLTINIPLHRNVVLEFFKEHIVTPKNHHRFEAYRLNDGSILLLCPSGEKDMVYVNYHLHVTPQPERKGVSYSSVILDFCKATGSLYKEVGDKDYGSLSPATFMSTVFNSRAFKNAVK